jgi:hypothetical protein
MLLDPQYFDFAISQKAFCLINIMQISSPIEEHLYECGYYASSNGKSIFILQFQKSISLTLQEIIKKDFRKS